jgi:NADP-dependent 3-hydroxy acid dehydrogenase YdfG
MKLEGTVAVVFGGGSGIGRASATSLLAAGARVIVADLDDAAMAEVVAASGGRIESAVIDVTDGEAVQRLIDATAERFGAVDVVVNSAGVAVGGPAEDFTLAQWHTPIEVNLLGTVNAVAAVYPGMVQRGRGHIVNIASLAGLAPAALLTSYAASKWGVVGLSQSLRNEAGEHGVGVSVICPGPVATPLLTTGGRGGHVAAGIDQVRYLESLGGPTLPPERIGALVVRSIEKDLGLVTPGRARAVAVLQRYTPRLLRSVGLRYLRRELAAR